MADAKELRPLIYDLEIIKAIPDRDAPRLPGIEYCKGWGDHANMGISVLCAWDGVEKSYRIFMQDNLQEFAALVKDRYPLVSFNGIRFDNHVLAKAGGITIDPAQCYDIKAYIATAVGNVAGYTLDACSESTLKIKKSEGMQGALAPILWQRGNIGKVIDYCLNDVRMTAGLYGSIIKHGMIISPVTKQPLMIQGPMPHVADRPLSRAVGAR